MTEGKDKEKEADEKLDDRENLNNQAPIDPYTGEPGPLAQNPGLSADDIDAAWEDSIVAGEESVGGSAPTPDQDVVEEIGDALGITYEDDEPLDGAEKLEQRDRQRWELDPASAEDQDSEDEDAP